METQNEATQSALKRSFRVKAILLFLLSSGVMKAQSEPSMPQRGEEVRDEGSAVVLGCGAAVPDLLSRSRRAPGADPPEEGMDAIKGYTLDHPRPPAPTLPEVIPGTLIEIPAGPFVMGSHGSPDEQPRRTLTLPTYYLENTEVSVGQFKNFVTASGYARKELWSEEGWAWRSAIKTFLTIDPRREVSLPVVGVSFYEAEAYCRFLGRRLPTEEEWEKAARGTDGRNFPWGEESDPTKSNHWLYKKGPPSVHDMAWPVNSGEEGKSPYGILHLSGNVSEWTLEAYHSRIAPGGETRASSPWKTVRGGSWVDLLSYQRAAHREPALPGERRLTLGFRCAADRADGASPVPAPTPSAGASQEEGAASSIPSGSPSSLPLEAPSGGPSASPSSEMNDDSKREPSPSDEAQGPTPPQSKEVQP